MSSGAVRAPKRVAQPGSDSHHFAGARAAKTKRYPSDRTGTEWAAMEGLLPKPAQHGRRTKADLREVINTLRHLMFSGCGLRMCQGLSGLANGVMVVLPTGALLPVPDTSRRSPDARFGVGRQAAFFQARAWWIASR